MDARVMIVDDDPADREILEALLHPDNYQIAVATCGEEALGLLSAFRPDLVLLDVMLPDIDGFEVCQRLRTDPEHAQVPVIMVTALDDRDSRLRGIECGADDFLSKPFDAIELRARVRTIMRLNRFRRLHEERRKFERLVEIASDGIILTDAEGYVRFANPAMADLMGVASASDLVDRRVHDLIAPDQVDSCSACNQCFGGCKYRPHILHHRMVTCFWIPSVISTWFRIQFTHMFGGFGGMEMPHRQHSTCPWVDCGV